MAMAMKQVSGYNRSVSDDDLSGSYAGIQAVVFKSGVLRMVPCLCFFFAQGFGPGIDHPSSCCTDDPRQFGLAGLVHFLKCH